VLRRNGLPTSVVIDDRAASAQLGHDGVARLEGRAILSGHVSAPVIDQDGAFALQGGRFSAHPHTYNTPKQTAAQKTPQHHNDTPQTDRPSHDAIPLKKLKPADWAHQPRSAWL